MKPHEERPLRGMKTFDLEVFILSWVDHELRHARTTSSLKLASYINEYFYRVREAVAED